MGGGARGSGCKGEDEEKETQGRQTETPKGQSKRSNCDSVDSGRAITIRSPSETRRRKLLGLESSCGCLRVAMRNAKGPIPFHARPWVTVVPFIFAWGFGLIVFFDGGLVSGVLFTGLTLLVWFR